MAIRVPFYGAVVLLNQLDSSEAFIRRHKGIRFQGVSTVIFYQLSQKVGNIFK